MLRAYHTINNMHVLLTSIFRPLVKIQHSRIREKLNRRGTDNHVLGTRKEVDIVAMLCTMYTIKQVSQIIRADQH